jgi:hypothetical protein
MHALGRAFARDVLALFERFEADIVAVCVKHTMSPALFNEFIELDGLKRELRREVEGI